MSQPQIQPFGTAIPAYQAPFAERAAFLQRTYTHLAGAVAAFVVLCAAFVEAGIGETMLRALGGSQFGWLMLMGGFVGASWIATNLAHSAKSSGVQYMGLSLLVVAEAVFFAPILFIATQPAFAGTLPTAAALTLVVFGGLTAYVHATKKDFSFLRGILSVGFLVAIGVMIAGMIFGFGLGIFFTGALVLLAAGAVLYDTSKVLHHYPTTHHVGAALELFASVAMLFYYILILLMKLQRR